MYEVSIENRKTIQLRNAAGVEVIREKGGQEIVIDVIQSKRGCGAARAIVKTTAEWEAMEGYIPEIGAILVYSDWTEWTAEDGSRKAVPAIKIGNGKSEIGELPFLGAESAASILTLTEEEVRKILGDMPPEHDGPDAPPAPPCPPGPPEILTEDEIMEILNKGSGDPPNAEAERGNILTDDEILAILNNGQNE